VEGCLNGDDLVKGRIGKRHTCRRAASKVDRRRPRRAASNLPACRKLQRRYIQPDDPLDAKSLGEVARIGAKATAGIKDHGIPIAERRRLANQLEQRLGRSPQGIFCRWCNVTPVAKVHGRDSRIGARQRDIAA
jgi:hypothetical protein